jgi:hypothetical protein
MADDQDTHRSLAFRGIDPRREDDLATPSGMRVSGGVPNRRPPRGGGGPPPRRTGRTSVRRGGVTVCFPGGVWLERPDCRRREHPGPGGHGVGHSACGTVIVPARRARHQPTACRLSRARRRARHARWYIGVRGRRPRERPSVRRGRRRGCRTRSRNRRGCGRSGTRAVRAARTRCASCARRCGSRP